MVTFIFELGEACTEEVQKPHCGELEPLVALLVDSNIPCSNHQLVAVAVLEVFVRYSKVFAGQQQRLAGVVATFLDSRGLMHPVEVRNFDVLFHYSISEDCHASSVVNISMCTV